MDENVTKFLREASFSSMDKTSSDSSHSEEISKPTSSKRKKNVARDESENNVSTLTKSSSSIKCSREGKEKEEIELSSKKMKESTQVDEKSPRKRGYGYWTPEDEIKFLKGLVAFCEKGKLKNLPKEMGPFFQLVLKDLDGQYRQVQLYNKALKLRAKYFRVRNNMKDKGFVGFKVAHEEAVYMLSKQVWGKGEEEDVGSVKMGKEGSVRVEEKKQLDVGEREEVKRNKTGDVEKTVMELEGEEDEEEDGDDDDDDEEEEEEEEEEKEEGQDKCEQIDNVGVMKVKEASDVSDSGRNACMKTEKIEENAGEETDSYEENVGEEQDSSEQSETESSGNEYKNVREDTDFSEESEESETESSGNEYDRRGTSAGYHDTGKNSSQSVEEGNLDAGKLCRGNWRPNGACGMSNGSKNVEATEHSKKTGENPMHSGGNRMSNGSWRTATPNARENSTLHASGDGSNGSRTEITDLRNNGENFVQYILNSTANGTMENFQSSLNTARSFNGFPFAWELPALSDKEEEMLDKKWKEQQLLEMEVASKHLALLQEECQLRLAKLRAVLGEALP